MARPGFFIIGAPKCGTTSLAAWLYQHPRVFMSRAKEPSYFDTDSPRVGVRHLAHYLRCFEGAGPEHLAVGEASPNYLYSSVAVQAILRFNPDAKFVVALRDPVRMAASLHAQLCFNHHESVLDFHQAWALQERRRRGLDMPPYTRLPHFLQYRQACSLGTQLERLLGIVPRHRVRVVILEDMQTQPRAEYQRLLDFLDIPDDGRTEFPIMNARASRYPGRWQRLRRDVSYLKQRLGIAHWSRPRWATRAPAHSAADAPSHGINEVFRAELRQVFESEVILLERLLDRDLRSLWKWREPEVSLRMQGGARRHV